MEEKDWKNIGIAIMGIAIAVWVLAVYWHPFGTPKIEWHVINCLVVFLGFLVVATNLEDKKVDKDGNE